VEEIEEDREDREDRVDREDVMDGTSEIMDSGEDVDDAERARDDRRPKGGYVCSRGMVFPYMHRGRWSRVVRATDIF
jgi:hypothetical protein